MQPSDTPGEEILHIDDLPPLQINNKIIVPSKSLDHGYPVQLLQWPEEVAIYDVPPNG